MITKEKKEAQKAKRRKTPLGEKEEEKEGPLA